MVKKILLLVLILAVCIVGGYFLKKYLSFKKDDDPYKTFLLPRIELAVVEVHSFSDQKIDATISVLIDNPSPIGFKVDSLQYEITAANTTVMKSIYKDSIRFKGNDSSIVALPARILTHQLHEVNDSLSKKKNDSAIYELHATFYTNLPFKKHFNITIKRKLPIIWFPEFELDHVSIDSLNFKEVDLVLHTTIVNRNDFPLPFHDLSYKMQIENNDWAEGAKPGHIKIPEHSETKLTLPLELTVKEIAKTAIKMLMDAPDVDYHFIMSFEVDAEKNTIKDSKVTIENSGKVKSLLKQVKEIKKHK